MDAILEQIFHEPGKQKAVEPQEAGAPMPPKKPAPVSDSARVKQGFMMLTKEELAAAKQAEANYKAKYRTKPGDQPPVAVPPAPAPKPVEVAKPAPVVEVPKPAEAKPAGVAAKTLAKPVKRVVNLMTGDRLF